MRITKVTPIKPEPSGVRLEVAPGEFSDVDNEWYQSDIGDLKSRIEAADLSFREQALMRKAVGFESGLLVGLMIWGGSEVFKVLAAWLPAREGRKVRVRLKDGTEIEAQTVKRLEQIRDKFLTNTDEDNGND